jgi:tetratricopeptide (TPR) repeat protein
VLRSQGASSEDGMIKGKPFLEKTKGALLENSRLELQLGRIAAARQEIMKYLHIVPRDAKAFYLLGEVSRLKGDGGNIRLARALYEKAISLDPSYAEPYRALGFIQYKAGELTLAGKSFRWCLLLSPHRKDRAYIHAYLKKCGETHAGGKKGS